MVSCFLLLVAVSSTLRDFKPNLICKRGVAWSFEKCLKHLREAKHMKPLWKVKGFEKPTPWKVSVVDCVFFFHEKMSKKSDADMYIFMCMKTVTLRVCATHTQPHTHNHTQQRTSKHTHTQQHTSIHTTKHTTHPHCTYSHNAHTHSHYTQHTLHPE